ncbi:MAG: inositol 2-dehydrogenase [Azospirillaceae bacterium]|nr:inositol 2-dehydrogenase [Azospirillaceae bacterium]
MLRFGLLGAGRIGAIHGANIAAHGAAQLVGIADIHQPAAEALAAKLGTKVASVAAILADPAIDAVVIASSTDTHAPLIEAAARAGKAIFCEKPIDLDSGRVAACLKVVADCGVPLGLGFNRRFDPSFRALRDAVRAGRIGKVEMVCITSRDPGPPPVSYIKVSGGLFRDMMIHDLDMARWLLGEEPVEVFATASCLVDPAIGAAGDVDTAIVTLKTASGVLCQINNSRRAVYGYDQRVEVLGSAGMLQAGNRTPTTVECSDGQAVSRDKPLHFFLERYAEAYRSELDGFIRAVAADRSPDPGGDDGYKVLLLADAAAKSFATGQPVRF